MNRYLNSLTLPLAVAMAVGTVDAKAQALEEVIVTAQKREQSLQDVPIAVAAFSNEMLQKAGVKDMFELQANDPSLVVGQGHNASTSSFGIRGVFTSSNNFGLESSVGLYVDGVYRARQGSMLNDLVDIGRIEILRGPQGTLFGRNTPAGAISVFSVEPDFEGTGYLQVEGGEYSLLSGQGAKSFTVIEDILATRVTGFYTERDGTISDVSLGDDKINDRDRWGVRLQALWTPTDELSVHVIADHSEIDEVNRPGFPGHFVASKSESNGGRHGTGSFYRRVQTGGGSAGGRARPSGCRGGSATGCFPAQPLRVAEEAPQARCRHSGASRGQASPGRVAAGDRGA